MDSRMGLSRMQVVPRKSQKGHGKLVAETRRCPLDPQHGQKKIYQNVVLIGEGILGVKGTLPTRFL